MVHNNNNIVTDLFLLFCTLMCNYSFYNYTWYLIKNEFEATKILKQKYNSFL